MELSFYKKELGEYLQLFTDAGWEHLGRLGGWQYFRKAVQPGEQAEIFTDVDSKIQKYSRVMMFLVILLPVYFIMIPTLANQEGSLFISIIGVIYTLIMIVLSGGIIALMRRISQLKKLKQ